jgi:hypothetical protein
VCLFQRARERCPRANVKEGWEGSEGGGGVDVEGGDGGRKAGGVVDVGGVGVKEKGREAKGAISGRTGGEDEGRWEATVDFEEGRREGGRWCSGHWGRWSRLHEP